MSYMFKCMHCGSVEAAPFMLNCKDYYLGKPYKADYYKCTKCNLVQQSPLPSDVGSFYEDYPVHRRKSIIFEWMRRRVMRSCYFDLKSPGLAGRDSTFLVDFGCGDGWYLNTVRDRCSRLVGYEPDRVLADRLAKSLGIPVYSDELALLYDCKGQVDIVTMHFVLEHLLDIHRAFQSVQCLLKTDGLFYITVPNISSWESRLFGRKWHNLDPPRHISFPDAQSIAQLSTKWGFEIVRSSPVSFPNGVAGSIPSALFGRFMFLVFLLSLPLGILLSRLFPSGNMSYVLRRVSIRVDDEQLCG